MADTRTRQRIAATAILVAGCLATAGIGWAAVANHVVQVGQVAADATSSAAPAPSPTTQPPTATGPTGVPRLAWSTSAAALGVGGQQLGVVAQTASTIVLGAQNQTTLAAETFIGVAPTTGAVQWRTTTPATCSGLVGHDLLCTETPDVTRWEAGAGDTFLGTLDVETGAYTTGPSLRSLGFHGQRVAATTLGTGPSGAGLLEVADDDSDTSTYTLARLGSGLSTVAWRHTATSCEGSSDAVPSAVRDQDGVLLVSNADDHFVVSAATGRSLAALPCGTGDLFGNAGLLARPRPPSVSAPLSVATPTSEGAVDFSASAETPSSPVVFSADADGVVHVRALRPDGSALWRRSVALHGSAKDPDVFGAADAGRLVLVDTAGHVVSLDPATGAVRWRASYPAVHDSVDGAAYVAPTVAFDGAGNVLVTDADPTAGVAGTHAFDAASGAVRAVPSGWARPLTGAPQPVDGVVAVVQDSGAVGALVDPPAHG